MELKRSLFGDHAAYNQQTNRSRWKSISWEACNRSHRYTPPCTRPPRCSYVIQSGLCLLLNMRRARGGRAQDASRKRRRITRDSRSQSPAEERKKSAAFTPGRRHTRGGVVQQLAGLARTKRSAAGASVDSIRLRARARSGRIGFRSRCGTYRIFLRRPRSRRRCCRVQSWCCLVRVSLAARHPPPSCAVSARG